MRKIQVLVSCQLVQCRATEARHDDPHGTQASGRSWNTVGRQSDGNLGAGGTRPRLGIRDIDYQLVRKSSVETQPKNVGVSTLSLKIRLIIN